MGTWVDRTPCRIPYAWPPTFVDARTVFDADRSRVVVIGNRDYREEVWEVDPATGVWSDRTRSSVAMPPASGNPDSGGVLVFDEHRGTLVLLGQKNNIVGVWELAVP